MGLFKVNLDFISIFFVEGTRNIKCGKMMAPLHSLPERCSCAPCLRIIAGLIPEEVGTRKIKLFMDSWWHHCVQCLRGDHAPGVCALELV
jgi:hypothetical protein